MYITITPQKMVGSYSKSCRDYVSYLEKENEMKDNPEENFFDQYRDSVPPEIVIQEIDRNTARLGSREPRFYSITVSPSKYELQRLSNSSQDLQKYTRKLMEQYIKSFNRQINGKPMAVTDIIYFAKIEHQRCFKGTDRQVKENQPYASTILQYKNDIQKIQRGEKLGSIDDLTKQIKKLEEQAPHQQDGKRITQGMPKSGNQSHIHIIVSRKDASNRFSLSPGSKYRSSTTELNGRMVKRGFDRDLFFRNAEKCFDREFQYIRNYVEQYQSRKEFIRKPDLYFKKLLELPINERSIAIHILRENGLKLMPNIPLNQAQFALKAFNRLKRGLEMAARSGSISI